MGYKNSFVSTSITKNELLSNSAPIEYDVIFLLNVIDQLDNSIEYLKNLVSLLKSQEKSSMLIVSVPLPWTKTRKQKGVIPGDTFDESIKNLNIFFDALGLKTLLMTRAPYLCQGTYQVPLFSLDTAIFSLELKQ